MLPADGVDMIAFEKLSEKAADESQALLSEIHDYWKAQIPITQAKLSESKDLAKAFQNESKI